MIPEGFKTISPTPWNNPHNRGVSNASGTHICSTDENWLPHREQEANAAIITAAPDYALLLAAITKNVVQIDRAHEVQMLLVSYSNYPRKPVFKEFVFTVDQFGCPVLTDEARAAIIQALEESK